MDEDMNHHEVSGASERMQDALEFWHDRWTLDRFTCPASCVTRSSGATTRAGRSYTSKAAAWPATLPSTHGLSCALYWPTYHRCPYEL